MHDIEAKIVDQLNARSQPSDAADIKAWRDASPQNEQHYQDLCKVWQATAPLNSDEPAFDLEKGYRKLQERIDAASSTQASNLETFPSQSRLRTGPLLAMIALAAILLIAFFLQKPTAVTQYITSSGEMAAHTGRDYNIALAPSTQLMASADDASQFVATVAGKINVDVHTKGRQFILETAEATVKVLGTQFVLRSRDGVTSVTVFRGKVAFQDRLGGEPVILSAGTRASCNANSPIANVVSLGTIAEGSWSPLAFYRSPLAEVISDLQAHYGVKIGLDPQIDGAQTLNAQYQSQDDLATILEDISLSLGLSAHQDKDQWNLLPANDPPQ